MRRPLFAVALVLASLPVLLAAAPQGASPRPDPNRVSAPPASVQRVAPAMVGLRVDVPPARPSAATLGVERGGTGVIFDQAGYVLEPPTSSVSL